jgi:xanthine dehydrogenase YagR molybdenum-binding subunit
MSTSVIGQPVSRIDGPLKVSGRARYAADHQIPNLAYAYPVPSTIGNGRILRIDSGEAEQMSGVLAVLHHGNFGKLYRPANMFEDRSRASESRPPFDDDVVYYNGQYVAVVIADTFERAKEGAAAVRVEYDPHPAKVLLGQNPDLAQPPAMQYRRGDADRAFASAPVKIDETYNVPVETHNPMEMHATIAQWNGDHLTLYETTQGVVNHHNVMSQVLDMPLENITVISPFCGSGFGDKLFPWPQSALAAVAARKVGRPVKITVPRSMMFTTVGHRPHTRQRIRLGAAQDGTLVSLRQDVVQHTSFVDDYVENCTEPTSWIYRCPNVTSVQNLVHLNVGTPCPMRGPGTTPGMYAIDSAMNELADKLNLDPLELRLRNYADMDEGKKLPFSSKHLRECYQRGAEKFGWSRRNPKVGSMRDGKLILGWGMSTATWPAGHGQSEVRVHLLSDGTARASCATQDIGTGTYTIFAQVVSERTGIPVDKVQVVLGESGLPMGPTSGGSTATASVLPGIANATDKAVQEVFRLAARTDKSPFQHADPATLAMTGGRVHAKNQSPSSGVPYQDLMKLRSLASLGATGSGGPDEETRRKYSFHSYGAHFCEITYDPEIVRLRVNRWVTVMDAGRMINPKTAANQIAGGIVMGIGMGLFEETVYDPRTAQPINNNFADYIVPLNPDIPHLDVSFLEIPDPQMGEFGARGVGEIGLTGCASALTHAVYHATGVRVRDLPIRIEQLLGEPQEQA